MIVHNLNEELKDINISKDSIYFVEQYLNSSSYICDAISEHADGNVDIYNSDLFEWAKYNFSYIEEANEEFGAPNDIIKQIQQAQYLYNERQLYDELEEIILYSVLLEAKEYAEEVTKEQFSELLEVAEHLDHNDRFDDIKDAVKEVFEKEDEQGE
jgi:hypothetical protein